jgi:hypothetical protein
VLVRSAGWQRPDVALNGRVYLVTHDGPYTCPDGEVVEVATVPLSELDGWLEGRNVCPDSVELVAPVLPR